MKNLFKAALCLLLSGSALGIEAQTVSIIPKPAQIIAKEGTLTLTPDMQIAYDAACTEQAEYLLQTVRRSTGFRWKEAGKKSRAGIVLEIDSLRVPAPEGYTLEVSGKRIAICGHDKSGVFYGIQTLLQLLPPAIYSASLQSDAKWSVPCISVVDAPDHPWRGMMLDVARYFYDKDFVKKYIDMMAMYKMNKLQFHLIDDSGWRLEIKKYPRLTEVGAWRNSKVLGWGDVKPDGQRYGGFYTHEDVKEIVAYAAARFIEIVPEVDIPGHSQAAVAAYPEFLACDPEQPHEVWLWQGVSADVINVAEPRAVQFACDVIDELAALFPFGYIHLGGDECPTDKWERNALCQARLKEIGSEKYRDLQIDFYHKLQQHIARQPLEKQRKLIFWNEVLHGNTQPLGKDIAIMAWIGADGAARDAAGRGFNTILSPQIPYYINRRQSPLATEPRSQGPGTETVEAVYNYVPAKDVPADLQAKYLGVQANFWTEWVEDAATVEYLMLPRLAAVAEAGWTPQPRRSYPDFLNRLQGEAVLYELMGVSYGKHVFE